MNRLKMRWAAWPAALLLVLSVSGIAGAAALISFNGPAASALEHSAVAQAVRAALGADEDEDTDENAAEDSDTDADTDENVADADEDGTEEDAEAATLPTDEELATCGDAEDLAPADGESHGDYVSRIAGDVSITGGPNDNHGFCVSAAARGLFEDSEEETTEEDVEAAVLPTDEELASCGDLEELAPAEGERHGDYVSRIAGDVSITGGPNDNHGFCVSAAARGLFENATAEDATAATECETPKRGKPTADVEDEDVTDATATCTEDAKAKAKAEREKARAEAKAEREKAKAERAKARAEKVHGKSGAEHGKGRGRGHRP